MLPSALCQGVGVLKFGVFRGSFSWPIIPPVNASYLTLRPCPHDSEPVWLARPSLYDSFIRYILPAFPGASASGSRCQLGAANSEFGAAHQKLALRHATPGRVLQVYASVNLLPALWAVICGVARECRLRFA